MVHSVLASRLSQSHLHDCTPTGITMQFPCPIVDCDEGSKFHKMKTEQNRPSSFYPFLIVSRAKERLTCSSFTLLPANIVKRVFESLPPHLPRLACRKNYDVSAMPRAGDSRCSACLHSANVSTFVVCKAPFGGQKVSDSMISFPSDKLCHDKSTFRSC
ncbi:hypothetical protein MPSEU_000002100 [Mayamaea pseudoterrestris]|nr:hypothetical protein MPSEU_000002100 [Mayamaea pseudoterrestris]